MSAFMLIFNRPRSWSCGDGIVGGETLDAPGDGEQRARRWPCVQWVSALVAVASQR